jgi:ATP-dependent Clp protease ATP-binding subunit ClpA
LYDLSIKYNPFLEVTIKEVSKLNKNLKQFKKGTASEEEESLGKASKARTRLSKVPKEEVLNLETNVLESLFGQDEAVREVCNSVKRAYSGLKLNKKPVGAFLFYGPTSTGKTELAKVLAKLLTKSETEGLVKIACNSLQTDHSINTLIGAPPSYVGYEDRGLLYSSYKKSNFKVLLFDEIDKATPRIFDLLLEMLEEGRILIADGSVIDLTKSIILMTSNIGQKEANNALNVAGFQTEDIKDEERSKVLESQYKKILKDRLKPEFLARLNGTFYFKELSEENLLKTVKLQFRRYSESWKKKFKLEVEEEVHVYVLDKCKEKFGKNFHARTIRDFIDIEIIQKIGDLVIAESTKQKIETIKVSIKEGSLEFSIKYRTRRSSTSNRTSSKSSKRASSRKS